MTDKHIIIIDLLIERVIDLFNFFIYAVQIIVLWKYFYFCLFAVIILIILYVSIKHHKKWKSEWLSFFIEEEISKTKISQDKVKFNNKFSLLVRIKNFFELIKLRYLEFFDSILNYIKYKIPTDFRQRYLPSLTSFILLFVLFLFLFYISHIDISYKDILSLNFRHPITDVDKFGNIVAVITGLVAVIFALVIFVAESIRDNKDQLQKKILLKESKLWFLITFTILSLLNFLWFQANILSIFFPIIIACVAILAFWKVILNLINPTLLQENKAKFLKERMRRIIFDSVRERIGNHILLNKVGIDKEIKIEYTFSKRWMHERTGDYVFIESQQEGFLSDIHFGELSQLVNYLEKNAKQLAFSIYDSKFLGLKGEEAKSLPQARESVKKVYLLKRYGEYLPENSIFNKDNRWILALPKEFTKTPDVILRVQKLIPYIFKFSAAETASDNFRKELKSTKDQLIKAIREFSLGEVEELKKLYLQFAESFLEVIHQFGGGFSFEQAKKERGNIFEAWNEVRWLNEDIREVLAIAVKSENKDIISDIAYLPIAIAIRAVQARDHLLFQEFIGFAPYLYYLSHSQSDERAKSFMIERAWRYIKELSNFYIEPELKDEERENSPETLKEYRDFAIYVFLIFQRLLKSAFDSGDLDGFKEIMEEFRKLYRHFKPEHDYPNAEHFRWELKRDIQESQKEKIQKKLKHQEAQEEIAAEIRLKREQIFFGLTAWIFEKYRVNKQDAQLGEFYRVAQNCLPIKIEDLTNVFLSARTFETEDFFNWGSWEMIADGEVYTIDFESKLDRLYCVKALQLLQGKTEEDIAKIQLPHNRSLAFLVESGGNLTKTLEDIKANSTGWDFVLPKAAVQKIESLEKLLKNAKDKQDEEEKDQLKSIEVSEKKVQEFIDSFQKDFYRSASLRKIASKFGIIKDSTGTADLKPDIKLWGFNQIDNKEAFIEDWHVHYVGHGEHYGSGLAQSENETVFREIANNLPETKISNKKNMVAVIEKLLKEGDLENPIVIGSFNYDIEYNGLKQLGKFIDKWDNEHKQFDFKDFDSYLGYIKLDTKNIPVFRVFLRGSELKKSICIIAPSKIGEWLQYAPIEKKEDKKYQKDIFMVRIRDLNKDKELREKLIETNPEWLQKETDKDGYLRQKVVTNIFEKFEFKIIDNKAGYKLTIQ